jgi:hypothetical protein
MTLADRTRAYGYALATELGLGDEVARRQGDADKLERMLGLRRGRGGGLRDRLGDSALLADAFPSPTDAHAALQSVSDEELELARRLVHTVLIWAPALMPLIASEEGDVARDFVALARKVFVDPPALMPAAAVIGVTVLLRRKKAEPVDVREQLAEFVPAAVNLELLATLPKGQRRAMLSRLPGPDRDELVEAVRRTAQERMPIRIRGRN